MAAEGTLTPLATAPPPVSTTTPTAAEPPPAAESYQSVCHPSLTLPLDLPTDAPKPASHIRYRYTKEQMYAIAASKASQIKPPRLPAIVCRKPSRPQGAGARAEKLGPPPGTPPSLAREIYAKGLAAPADKRTRDRNKKEKDAASWKDRPEGTVGGSEGELESLRPGGSKQFPSSQLGKANLLGDGTALVVCSADRLIGTKTKGAARAADARGRGDRGATGAAKREDPRLRNRKDRETFGFDVSSPLEGPPSLDNISAASVRDPEEVSRFAALGETADAAPEPFALVAEAAPEAVPLTDMLLMEKKLSSAAATATASEPNLSGDDSRFGRWFEHRDSPPPRGSSLLAAAQSEPSLASSHDSAIISLVSSAPAPPAQASAPAPAVAHTPASAPLISSGSGEQARKAAPAPAQPDSSVTFPPSSPASTSFLPPASLQPRTQTPTAAPPATQPALPTSSAISSFSSSLGSAVPSGAYTPIFMAPHPSVAQAHEPHAQHTPEPPVAFPPRLLPAGDGAGSFPLPQISALPPSTFTSNALLSLLRQGEQRSSSAPKGPAGPPQKQPEGNPMPYPYGMPPPHMQMMPPQYVGQPGPMHASQMQGPPPHHMHMGPRPPTHTPLPPPAGFAPPGYTPAPKGSAAGAPPPQMMKAPAGYMPPYGNPPPGKMPAGYGPEPGYYYGPPQPGGPQQAPQGPPPQGAGQNSQRPPVYAPPPLHGVPPQQAPGLERWFGPMSGSASVPQQRALAVPMKSLDEIESQLSRDGRP